MYGYLSRSSTLVEVLHFVCFACRRCGCRNLDGCSCSDGSCTIIPCKFCLCRIVGIFIVYIQCQLVSTSINHSLLTSIIVCKHKLRQRVVCFSRSHESFHRTIAYGDGVRSGSLRTSSGCCSYSISESLTLSTAGCSSHDFITCSGDCTIPTIRDARNIGNSRNLQLFLNTRTCCQRTGNKRS